MDIPDEYYNDETYHLMNKTLTEDDREYITNTNGNTTNLLFKRWRMIINSIPINYYQQYYSYSTQDDRNTWLKKYLDLPTKDMTLMPEFL